MSAIDISEALAGETMPAAPTGRRCKFGRFLDALPVDQADEILARLAGDTWTDARLAKLISSTQFGYIGSSALGRHRNAMCPCGDGGRR